MGMVRGNHVALGPAAAGVKIAENHGMKTRELEAVEPAVEAVQTEADTQAQP